MGRFDFVTGRGQCFWSILADYGTGFSGPDSIESVAGRLVGSSHEPDLWLHRRRDAKWKNSLVKWADQIPTDLLAISQ